MKFKTVRMISVCLIILILSAGFAYAGVWDKTKGFLSEKAVEVIIAGLLAIVGVFWGGAKLWGKFVKEAIDIPFAVKNARDPDGPGGKSITTEEAQNIGKEVVETFQAGAEAYHAGKK